MSQKIAFPTDDGETISRHFGRARYFRVITLSSDGAETGSELRDKGEHAHHDHQHEHGQGHHAKFELLQDCRVLIAAGMGRPAYDRVAGMGLELFVTGEKTIAAALAAYQTGTLNTDMRRIHKPHHDHGSRQDVTFVDSDPQ